ncbi:GNAT family N-acetyltransferase [Agromyces cerinus]|uniref:Acetyltransferase (GNAT) family protein n=1 Tax=Agromyces cerinus subsp. cerinus TaxID=232089 RepID=A0A1N6DDC5_9MICO|nr:GNAT family N-acetyltransferase [Agromyces cerinus]SIN68829.1 Acetyltransferase (GNAT) family protein [Agromyces cerinus subsp. cerinus]
MPEIRPYRTADRDQLARICLLTAAAGGDATGVYSDDALMPEVFALPYVEYAPELAFVVADGDRVLGYVIGVADTAAFVEWWKQNWAPGFAARHPSPGEPTGRDPEFTEAQLIEAGTAPERLLIDELAEYPAHLHIDLLPELQGQGFGRRLIDTLRRALAARGVPAVHLGMDAANTGARAFYDRLGFHELPSSRPGSPLLGIATSDAADPGGAATGGGAAVSE